MPPQAAPKSPVSTRFSVRRAGRVVRHDAVERRRRRRPCPEPLAVFRLADRRAALDCGRAVGDRLGRERQVVRAGLAVMRTPSRARRARSSAARRRSRGAGCAPRAPVRAGRLDHLGDRQVLGAARAGGEEVGVAAPVGRRRGRRARGVLGVHDEQASSRPARASPPRSSAGVDAAGTRRRRSRQQEALEAEHAGVVQRRQVAEVARDRAAPEADVDVALAGGGGRAWSSRASTRHRGRDAVERHVDERGDAARPRRRGWRSRSPPTRCGPAR